MKGTEHSLWYTLLQIILVPLMLMVCFGLLWPITKGNITEEITGTKPEEFPGGITNKQRPFDLKWVEHVIGVGDEYQLSEIACEIADKINNDFMANVYSKSRQIEQGQNCERDFCLIGEGVGMFKLSSASNVNQPTDNIIPGARTIFSGEKCVVCEEPQNDPANSKLIPNLDEICINYNLWSKNNALCSAPIILGGKIVEFGNNKCFNGNSAVNNWGGHCDSDKSKDFCDDSDKHDSIRWCADKTYFNERLITDHNGDNIIDYSPGVRFWNDNSIILNKEPHLYMYGILWDYKFQRYDVPFEQMPVSYTTNNINDLNNIKNNLTNDYNFRVNRLGAWYVEAREIENFTFIPTADITFQNFYSQFGQNVRFELCNDEEDCIFTKPIKREFATCRTTGFSNINDNKITIKSNMNINGAFKAGKTYEISVKNWVGYYFSKEGWFGSISANSACYDYFDRTVSIYERDPVCRDFNGACFRANLCAPQGGFCTANDYECTVAGDCCCAQ